MALILVLRMDASSINLVKTLLLKVWDGLGMEVASATLLQLTFQAVPCF